MPIRYRNSFVLRALGVALLSIVAAGVALGQDEPLRVETNLVVVPVTVIDREGRYVTGLKRSDFEIFEDRVIQETSLFESIEAPVTVLLLLDTSGSMNENLDGLANAANSLVSQLKADDRIIVATFADDRKIHIVSPITKKSEFRQAITFQPRFNDSFTTTFNAVEEAIKYMKQFDGRKAIVLFSDGELFGRGGASEKSNLRDAEEQDAIIYTVRFGEYPTSQPGYSGLVTQEDIERTGNRLGITRHLLEKLIENVNKYMHGLSERTGGRSFDVESLDNLRSAFRIIGSDLGQRYQLGYYPKKQGKDGERRKITVKVNRPDVAVRSRNEVVYKKPKN